MGVRSAGFFALLMELPVLPVFLVAVLGVVLVAAGLTTFAGVFFAVLEVAILADFLVDFLDDFLVRLFAIALVAAFFLATFFFAFFAMDQFL